MFSNITSSRTLLKKLIYLEKSFLENYISNETLEKYLKHIRNNILEHKINIKKVESVMNDYLASMIIIERLEATIATNIKIEEQVQSLVAKFISFSEKASFEVINYIDETALASKNDSIKTTLKVTQAHDSYILFKKRKNFSSQAVNKLKKWIIQNKKNPYPTNEKKLQLCLETGLEPKQINNWFINARRRLLNTSSPDNDID
ncbi:Homeobox protein [Spraguea lophii 42_110]|uniref:Homeobox protein n=1 Tax=Spraguea lophii (strain 42_110) TaxID=1358809 RepID=S7WDX2_SPRLO|nr:Homeobox protein [Spraguea lophii 42_110]